MTSCLRCVGCAFRAARSTCRERSECLRAAQACAVLTVHLQGDSVAVQGLCTAAGDALEGLFSCDALACLCCCACSPHRQKAG